MTMQGFPAESFGVGLRPASKTVTFNNTAGFGSSGTSTTWFTTAGGLVVIEYIIGRVTTSLTGATATITLGVTGKTTLFLGSTIATTLVTSTGEIWTATTPDTNGIAVPAALKGIVIDQNIISAVAVSGITGGVLELNVLWRPLTPGASLT